VATLTLVSQPGRLAWIAFFTAAGVLAFELSLMRILLVASWHHFAFLVFSIALLGFGASGTVLTLLRSFFLKHSGASLFVLILASAVLMPLCVTVVQHIPVEARITPALVWRQVLLWLLYWAILAFPFFGGAAAIVLTLMLARQCVAQVYAANLMGSAVGLLFITAAMYYVPPAWLPWLAGAITLVGGLATDAPRLRARLAMWAVCILGATLLLAVEPPSIRMDAYKYGAHIARLEQQGEAERAAIAYSPRATVEAYRSELFHDLPFLSVGGKPPSVSLLLADGHLAGSVLDVENADDAELMEYTLMALPYAFAPSGPRVLLLGESGGLNIWLATRHRAGVIDVVQPDANVTALLRGPLRNRGGAALFQPAVTLITAEPRHALQHAPGRYDLIQLVELESSAAGSGGVGGLAENHLITVEGLVTALEHLTDDGLLVATRGIQTPARDNLKLFATFASALRRVGITEPARHIVVVRDYLAVCTMARTTPWSTEEIDQVRKVCTERELTPVWFSGVRPEELNYPDELESPPGEDGDWYHYAAKRLFQGSDGVQFVRDWPFDIRPPTDDRPFFLDFCKLKSMSVLKEAFGDLWLTRTELAFLFVIAAMLVTGLVAGTATWLPLLALRFPSNMRGWIPTLAYFAAIGLAFMFLEIAFLSRTMRVVGDPVTAAAVTIAGFLLFSGLGSLCVQWLQGRRQVRADRDSTGADAEAPVAPFGRRRDRVIQIAIIALVLTGLVELILARPLAVAIGPLPFLVRCAAALAAIAPLAFLMGFPMPAGLAQLQRGAPALIPWAWSVNGFTSVVAAPAATAIGMTWGYTMAGAIALALYAVPMAFFAWLPGRDEKQMSIED